MANNIKVECINNIGYEQILTLGRIYNCVSEGDLLYHLPNGTWEKRRFKVVAGDQPVPVMKEEVSKIYSEELVYRLWNDKTGERLEVSDDADGLELIELILFDASGCKTRRFTITKEQATWLAKVLPLKA